MVDAINNDPKITTRGNLIGPSLSSTQTDKGWTYDAIWNTNYIEAYKPALGALAAERCMSSRTSRGEPIPHRISVDTLTTTASRKEMGPVTLRIPNRSSPTICPTRSV